MPGVAAEPFSACMSNIVVSWYLSDGQEVCHAVSQDHHSSAAAGCFAANGPSDLSIEPTVEAGGPHPTAIVIGLVHLAPKQPVCAPFQPGAQTVRYGSRLFHLVFSPVQALLSPSFASISCPGEPAHRCCSRAPISNQCQGSCRLPRWRDVSVVPLDRFA